MLALLVVMTAAGQVVLTRLLNERFTKFNSAFLIYKAVKILVLMAFLIIYSTLHREKVIPFLGSTFIMYLVFMFFESRSLNRHSRKQSEQ
jgi:protein-S-isoprenylcysteine O-methyltransferase Ste14